MTETLKLPEVARRLGVSEKTARRYVKAGELPSVFVGNAYRVSEEDVEQYLRQARVTVGGEAPKADAPQPEDGERGDQETAAREETLRKEVAERDAALARKWAAQMEGSTEQMEILLHTHLDLVAHEKDAALAEKHRKLAGEWYRRWHNSVFLPMQQAAYDVPAFAVPELKHAFDKARERVLEFSQPHPTDLAGLEEAAEWVEEQPRTG